MQYNKINDLRLIEGSPAVASHPPPTPRISLLLWPRLPSAGKPGVERVLPLVDLALQPLGFFAGRRHRPGRPRADGQSPLTPGGPVDQHEPLAPGLADAKAEACAVRHQPLAFNALSVPTGIHPELPGVKSVLISQRRIFPLQ